MDESDFILEPLIKTNQYDIIKTLIDNGMDSSNPELFLYSARAGSYEICKIILDNIYLMDKSIWDIKKQEFFILTLKNALILSTQCGNIQLANLLLEHGAKATIHSLKESAKNGNLDIVKKFLELELVDEEDVSFFESVRENHIEIMELFLKKGLFHDYNKDDALYISAQQGYLDMVNILLNYGAEDKNHKVLSIAASNGNMNLLKKLINNGMYITPRVLVNACINGHIDIVLYLLEKTEIDIHAKNDEPFREAAKNGHINIVKLLLEHGANQSADNDWALRWACDGGKIDVVELLLKAGSQVHYDNDWAIRCSAGKGYIKIVELLIEYGGDIHSNNEECLLESVVRGHLEMLQFLYKNGGDININDGKLLGLAIEKNHIEIVKYLLDRNINVNANGGFPLKFAATNGLFEIVKILIEKGADINAENGYALRKSGANCHFNIVKYLIDNGANINVENPKPLTRAK